MKIFKLMGALALMCTLTTSCFFGRDGRHGGSHHPQEHHDNHGHNDNDHHDH